MGWLFGDDDEWIERSSRRELLETEDKLRDKIQSGDRGWDEVLDKVMEEKKKRNFGFNFD